MKCRLLFNFILLTILSIASVQAEDNSASTADSAQLYWSFDKDLQGWERTGSVPPWHTMESAIKWYDQWGGASGVIVIDACESTPSGYQAVHAKGGIKKSITLPQEAETVTFNVIRVDHDGGIRFLLSDSEGQHILGEEVLSGPIAKQLSYDISAWRGKTVTLEVQTFGAGSDDSGCVGSSHGCGSCCGEYVGIDWIKISTEASETPNCNSKIYLEGKQAVCIKAQVANNILNLELHPQEGWGVPNRASLIEMMGLKLKPVPVGEIHLGYDEDISVFLKDASIWYNYKDKGIYWVAEETSQLPEFIAPLIGDLEGCGHIWLPVGAAQSLLWTGFTDSSHKPMNDYFIDDNKYDNSLIAWPDQPVKFSGDLIDRAYMDYPNYIGLKIPLGVDAGSEGKKIHIYVKLLLTPLHNYGGAVVGDYQLSTYANCDEFEVPISAK